MLPPFAAMLALGVATAVLIGPLGVFALAPLALVVVVPQLALAQLGRDRSVTRLSRPEATQRSTRPRSPTSSACPAGSGARSPNASRAARPREPRGARKPTGGVSSIRTGAVLAAFHVHERWDGTGSPAGLPGAWTPARQPRARRRAGLERADRGRHAGAVALRGDAGPVAPRRRGARSRDRQRRRPGGRGGAGVRPRPGVSAAPSQPAPASRPSGGRSSRRSSPI